MTTTFYLNGSVVPYVWSPASSQSINYDPISQSYFIDMLDQAEVGEWEIVTTVNINHPVNGAFSQSHTWFLTVVDDCELTYLFDRDYRTMASVIGGFADI